MNVRQRVARRLGFDGLEGAGSLFPLGVLFGLNAVDEVDFAAFSVLAPDIARAFGLDIGTLAALTTIVVVADILVGIALGFVADRGTRTRMATIGAAVWGAFAVSTGLAPTVLLLVLARIGAGLGKAVNTPTHESLIADYYAPAHRAGAYAVHRMANSVGQFAGPLLAGVVAYVAGWRAPFLALGVPAALMVATSLRLREPIRGAHERRAAGAGDDLAAIEEAPPTWEEAWRLLRGIGTLRRLWYAYPFLVGGLLALGFLLNLYYDEVFHVREIGRGALNAASEPFQMLGLAVGVPLATRFVRTDPQRLFRLIALSGTGAAAGFVLLAVAPTVWVAAASAFLVSFCFSLVVPGLTTIQSLVLPPRVRSFGFVVARAWALSGVVFLLIGGAIGERYGMRAGIATMAPVFLFGSWLLVTASSQVELDIRRTRAATLAQAEVRHARDQGQAKLLVCRGIDVRYGAVQVLFGVDFDVADGEIVALLGTNGAGKSTLLKAIAGLIDPSAGAIVFDGADATFAPAQQLMRRGIVYMPGGRSVFPTLTVAENLTAAAWLDRADGATVAARTGGVLARFPRLAERIDQPAGNLSGGEQQMLGLGMAFLARPRLLMIDELSLGLAPAIVADLLDTVREIHAQGTTVVLVEQSVNVALSLAERAVFMEKGEVRFEGLTTELLGRDDILRSVFLEGAAQALGGDDQAASRLPAAPKGASVAAAGELPGRVVLDVDGITKRFGGILAVDGVSLSVPEAGVVGIIGPNGAGKTTLFDLMSGFLPVDEGRVRLAGVDVTGMGPDARARAGLGRSFQDARLFPSMTVREALAMGFDRHLQLRDPVSAILMLPDQQVEESLLFDRVDDLIDLLGLGAFADKFVAELSTGSRRIVDIGCAIAHDPDVLLLDEPSSGIAQREAEALGPLLRRIQTLTGTSLVVIEHDMPLITAISDVLVALDLGSVIATGSPEEVVRHPAVVASYLGSNDAAVRRSGGRA